MPGFSFIGHFQEVKIKIRDTYILEGTGQSFKKGSSFMTISFFQVFLKCLKMTASSSCFLLCACVFVWGSTQEEGGHLMGHWREPEGVGGRPPKPIGFDPKTHQLSLSVG